ncbi:MAG: GH116 family glycosyl hydrolase [Bacteroides sp.]|nr:GH116 family glycosyl hydrolase [Bacteroides sp.]
MNPSKFLIFAMLFAALTACESTSDQAADFNKIYSGEQLERLAFPMGGIGAGMICLEGKGSISHVSVRNKPDVYNEPFMFAALAVKGLENGTKVLEGPVPRHKIFGSPNSGNGNSNKSYGFPRFEEASFSAHFPFGKVSLKDADIPMEVDIQGWSPFVPGDEDNSSLPVAGLEYTFTNRTDSTLEMVFSYHSENFMRISGKNEWGRTYQDEGHSIQKMPNGFILSQACTVLNPEYKGDFVISTLEKAEVDYRWFRGGWYDAPTQLWNDIENLNMPSDTASEESTGASLYIPLKLAAGESSTLHLLFSWHVPHSTLISGTSLSDLVGPECDPSTGCCSSEFTDQFYEPWYSGKFKDIIELNSYWTDQYNKLKEKTRLFTSTFFASDLPPEVLDAVSANLSILKSPTVLRQKDGDLWAYEGCFDKESGCCAGSCTHVWNYAQAIPHLFPRLERTLRETEFLVSQDERGHQNFRSAIPIQPTDHAWHAAADGQLGGIIKVYRDWRISGDTEWLLSLWPSVKSSFDFCSASWDPLGKGILEEPHHNTYDIEFWGPDGMCSSIYLGACKAMEEMALALEKDPAPYVALLKKGSKFMEEELFNSEYFYQLTQWEGLQTPPPDTEHVSWNINYSEEAREILKKEGPKYQYGTGCLSDGIIGSWFGAVGGLPSFLDQAKVKEHLLSVYRYNYRSSLSDHVNPQRSGYAMGDEGGLLLCSWPLGGQPTLPFVYSNEVWTGIEYQVASHLMMMGEVEKGLEIVSSARDRYDGSIRNPYNEYECGHWYARALASYALIQGLTGLRYDAIERTLYINSQIGNDFQCFISTETGYGLAGLSNGEPFIEVVSGSIEVDHFINH